MESIVLITLIVALILGTLMIGSTIYVYVKKDKLRFGAIVMLVFGVILIGLSIWQTVSIQVSPNMGISASFESKLQKLEQTIIKENIYTTEKIFILQRDLDKTLITDINDTDLEKLRRREKIDALIKDGQYIEAINLDSNNVIPISFQIEKYVNKSKYNDAILLYPALKKVNYSGVGYDTYPALIFSYDQLGNEEMCIKIIKELEIAFKRDMKKGYGYLSRSQQMTWIIDKLKKNSRKMNSNVCMSLVEDLILEIQETITLLTKEPK